MWYTLTFVLFLFGVSCVRTDKDSDFTSTYPIFVDASTNNSEGISHKLSRFSDTLKPKLNVFIIGITNFRDGSKWENPLLSRHYRDNIAKLNTFFLEFGVEPVILSTSEETSSDNLRSWFVRQFVPSARNNVSLLFIMSHGERISGIDDLFLITSDTDNDASRGAIRGSELITYLEDLSSNAALNTTVFAFIEACHSGAIEDDMITVKGALMHKLRINTNLIVSSLPDDKSYRGSFIKALLHLWGRPTQDKCIAVSESSKWIHESLKEMHPDIKPYEQRSKVVLEFAGNFCLESFSKDRSVIFFNNLGDQSFSYECKGSDVRNVDDGYIEKKLVTPIDLTGDNYEFTIYHGSKIVQTLSVDLSSARYQMVVLGHPEDQISLARSFEEVGLYSEYLGLNEPFIVDNYLRAHGLYVNNNVEASVDRMLAQIDRFEEYNTSKENIEKIAFNYDWNLFDSQPGVNYEELANALLREGDFFGAAKYFWKASEDIKNDRPGHGRLQSLAIAALNSAGSIDDILQIDRSLAGNIELKRFILDNYNGALGVDDKAVAALNLFAFGSY